MPRPLGYANYPAKHRRKQRPRRHKANSCFLSRASNHPIHNRSTHMSRRASRRRFIKTSAVIGAGYWALGGIAPRESRSANEKIQFACVGVGGKGSSDSQDAGRAGDVVAICDVDERNLNAASVRWPNAKKYYDFRKMFEEM